MDVYRYVGKKSEHFSCRNLYKLVGFNPYGDAIISNREGVEFALTPGEWRDDFRFVRKEETETYEYVGKDTKEIKLGDLFTLVGFTTKEEAVVGRINARLDYELTVVSPEDWENDWAYIGSSEVE